MATADSNGAPTPQTDAEKQLVQLLEGGQVRPDFARELLKGMGQTREAAQAVMASVEGEPEKRVPFAEAVKLLEGKPDLEAANIIAEINKSRKKS